MHLSHPIKIDFGDDLRDVKTMCDEARSILSRKNFGQEEVSFIDDFVVSLSKIQFNHISGTNTLNSSDQTKLRDRFENVFENMIANL